MEYLRQMRSTVLIVEEEAALDWFQNQPTPAFALKELLHRRAGYERDASDSGYYTGLHNRTSGPNQLWVEINIRGKTQRYTIAVNLVTGTGSARRSLYASTEVPLDGVTPILDKLEQLNFQKQGIEQSADQLKALGFALWGG